MRMAAARPFIDEDGFTLVRRKNGKGRVAAAMRLATSHETLESEATQKYNEMSASELEVQSFLARNVSLKRKISQVPLWKGLLEFNMKFDVAVCYGLGSLNIQRTQLQLAVFCLLIERAEPQVRVYLYDPCHTTKERSLLSSLGFNILDDNDNGRRSFSNEGKIFFYMPHCERWLYSNVIEAHSRTLSSSTVLGNSFKEYVSRSSTEKDWVEKVAGIVEEKSFSLKPGADSVLDESILFESFNDLRLIRFPKLAVGAS